MLKGAKSYLIVRPIFIHSISSYHHLIIYSPIDVDLVNQAILLFNKFSHILFKVSNGLLLDEYQHNLDAALNNSGPPLSGDTGDIRTREEVVNSEEMEWVETKMHFRRSSF